MTSVQPQEAAFLPPDETGSNRNSSSAVLAQARQLMGTGHLAHAGALFEQVLERARQSGDRHTAVKALAFGTTLALRMRDSEFAALRGEEVLREGVALDLYDACAEACVSLVLVYGEAGLVDEALRLAEQTYAFARRASNSRWLALAHVRYADALESRIRIYGLVQDARVYNGYRAGRRLAHALGDAEALVAAMNNALLMLNRWYIHPAHHVRRRTRWHLRAAALLAQRLVKLTAVPELANARESVERNCALALVRAGHVVQGMALFEHARAVAQERGGASLMAYQTRLGLAKRAMGEREEARALLESSLVHKISGADFFVARSDTHAALIDMAMEEGDYSRAANQLIAMERERMLAFEQQFELARLFEPRKRALQDALHRAADAQRDAQTDPLTQLMNRRGFPARLAALFDHAHVHGEQFALAMIDIDRFKEINDTHGHLVGDQLLMHVAQLLRRHFDIAITIGRYGGDEFIIAAPGYTAEMLATSLERLREAIAHSPLAIEQAELCITLSAGVTDLREAGQLDALIHRADQHLYAAKRGGRNRVLARVAAA
ncbi:MAG: diguanylate cyclase [Burkholderiaceae bacterium]